MHRQATSFHPRSKETILNPTTALTFKTTYAAVQSLWQLLFYYTFVCTNSNNISLLQGGSHEQKKMTKEMYQEKCELA